MEKSFANVLQFVAPGTPLREGIDHVLRAKTGGLIVIGYNEKMKTMIDGGFQINCSFSPAYLYELAKMDGAIILNDAGTKILIANAQLNPDPSILSMETGMRHRTAERVAKQSGHLVVAISERRNVITLYKGEQRYVLKDIGRLLTKANQAIQTLEKYKSVLEESFVNLSALEFEEATTFGEVVQVIHQIEMVLRIKHEIMSYINELGTEGYLLRLQVQELLSFIEEEALLLLKDYGDEKDAEKIMMRLEQLFSMELLEDAVVLKMLGYPPYTNLNEIVVPKGYRVLHKIPKLPSSIIDNVVNSFDNIYAIMQATVEELDEVDGIGEVRARKIQDGLSKFKEQLLFNRAL